ncbi:MAG: SufD family Fe-S cluster assembly protein [Bacteroidales bacterium]|nr:SufD family Fe-S cluster assembly protein [Bacteroidales bacterium]
METMIVKSNDTVHKVYVLNREPAEWPESASQKNGDMLRLYSGHPACQCACVPQSIVVERDAKVTVVVLVLPGVSCDIKLDVRLAGEGAESNIYGAYVCGGEEKVKISVDMHHDHPRCSSRQLFKGIAGGVSKVDFYGKIIVAQDAQRTEAYQENHNILLSDGAKVDTKPQLEIYADDVKCSHGATIGRLNEEEQFYMRSRGISLEDAKVLQMISFIAPVLENIQNESQRDAIASEFESQIRRI